MSSSLRANKFSQCDFYLPFTPFVPNDRILKESLIIFTAHSIIPAKRLIHDLPQWAGRRKKRVAVISKSHQHVFFFPSQINYNFC